MAARELGEIVRSMRRLLLRLQACALNHIDDRDQGQLPIDTLRLQIEDSIQVSRDEIEEFRQASTRPGTIANLEFREALIQGIFARYQKLEQLVVQLERNSFGETDTNNHARRVLVVTALPLEAQAVRTELDISFSDFRSHILLISEGAFCPPGGTEILVRLITVGTLNIAAAIATTLQVVDFKPTSTFFVGVAGAVPDVNCSGSTVSLGDVIVSSKIYGQSGVITDSELGLRPMPCYVSKKLSQIGMKIASEYTADHVGGDVKSFSVHFKPILSSDYLIKSRESPIFRRLVASFPDAYAVDQEALGFGYASNALGVDAIAVRGLSDNLDEKTAIADSRWQPKAASNAATILKEMLEELSQQVERS